MWDVHNFTIKSNRVKCVEEFDALVKFHEFEMILVGMNFKVLICLFLFIFIWVQSSLTSGSLTMCFVFKNILKGNT
jgi:hypothetical protein